MLTRAVPKDDPRTVFGWCMYDWANSAYVTTVAVAILPIYFADAVVGSTQVRIAGRAFATESLWGFAVGVAAFLAFVGAPVLGSIADFSAARKRFLLAFAYMGCAAAFMLIGCGPGDVVPTLLLFVAAQVGFVGANVFYDAFLPQIASDAQMDRVSSRGYAYGYVGGGLQFLIALLLVRFSDRLGLDRSQAARAAIGMAAVWWAGFTLLTARYLREPGSSPPLPNRYRGWPRPLALAHLGFARTWATTRRVGRYRHLALFLLAFMLYDDGIQTVIAMATIYGRKELNLSSDILLATLLMIQAVGGLGAWAFGRAAGWLGTRRTIMLSLVLWSGIVVYACFTRTAAEFMVLGGVVGMVLGGSQALSRSYYGSMIPGTSAAEFYGFYTVFSKFSSIWGPILFGFVREATGSSRAAIVSIVVLFVAGLILLGLLDEAKARAARFDSDPPGAEL